MTRPRTEERLRAAEAILAEAVGRAEASGTLDIRSLCADHPDLAEELQRLHAAWEWMEDAAPRCAGGPRGSCPLLGIAGEGVASPGQPRESRYQFLDSVARGGMGRVLRVWDQRLRRPLAMKVAGSRSTGGLGRCGQDLTIQRFLHEAYVMSLLDHPGVVPLHDIGIDERGHLFFTMRLVDGYDFGAVLTLVSAESAGWSLPRAVEVLVDVCETVAYAHSKGVIHRDLKPANVMVGPYGQVYVVDWGLARTVGKPAEGAAESWPEFLRCNADAASGSTPAAADDSPLADSEEDPPLQTREGSALGTPAYMPPEQARGDHRAVGMRADVYSVGAMLYHLLAGRAPFIDLAPGEAELLAAVRDRGPTPIRELAPRAPPELISVCSKAMAREVASRYPDLLGLAADLRAWLDDRPVSAHRYGRLAPGTRWVRQNPRAAIALGVTTSLALLALGATYVLGERGSGRIEDLERDVATARGEVRREAALAQSLDARAAVEGHAARLAGAQVAIRDARVGIARAILEECPPERRGFEWRHLHSRLDASLRSWGDSHREEPRSALLSADGQRAYLTTSVGPVQEADTSTGRVLRSLSGLTARGTAIAMSPDGSWLASGDASGRIQIWDLPSGTPRRNWAAHGPGHLWDIEIDRTGALLASVAADGATRVWSVPTGELVHELRAPAGQVFSADFDASAQRLLTSSEDGELRIWDLAVEKVATRRKTRDYTSNQYWRACFLEQGRWIGHGTGQGTFEILDAGTLAPHASLVGHAGFAHEILPCGEGLVVTSAHDGSLRLWSTADWRCLGVLLGHEADVCSLALDGAGRRLISGSADGTARLWDLAAGGAPDVETFDFPVDAIAEREGRLLLSGAGFTRLLDLATREVLWTRRSPGSTSRIRWSPDGKRIGEAGCRGEIAILDAQNGSLLANCPRYPDGGTLSFHPDGRRVATGGLDGAVRICNVEDGSVRASLANGAGVYAVEFDPAGKVLAVGDASGRIRIWDFERKTILKDLPAHANWTFELAFSRDGERLVSSSWDTTAAVWDARTWERVASMQGHTGYVLSAVFSQDGSRVATTSSDMSVRIWDSRSGAQLLCLHGHGTWVNDAVFAPDDSWLASVSSDSTLRIWRAP